MRLSHKEILKNIKGEAFSTGYNTHAYFFTNDLKIVVCKYPNDEIEVSLTAYDPSNHSCNEDDYYYVCNLVKGTQTYNRYLTIMKNI